jgi:uncharacterized phage protein (TIGR01671 family)
MRAIKFRVWDGRAMVYDVITSKFGTFYVSPGTKGDGLDEKDTASLTQFNTKYPENTPLMQSTGLKDNDGVECFEGDIIRDLEDDQIYEVVWGGKFSYPAFDVNPPHGSDSNAFSHMALSGDGFEVIGNIYENPELLEVKK